MNAENKRSEYIVIGLLCAIIIILAIGYNSLKNEVIRLEETINILTSENEDAMQSMLWAESDELIKLTQRIEKLEATSLRTRG